MEFVIGLLIFMALIALATQPFRQRRKEQDDAHRHAELMAQLRTAESDRRRVPCPHCAELILPEAKICRFCGRDVVLRTSDVSSTIAPTVGARVELVNPRRRAYAQINQSDCLSWLDEPVRSIAGSSGWGNHWPEDGDRGVIIASGPHCSQTATVYVVKMDSGIYVALGQNGFHTLAP